MTPSPKPVPRHDFTKHSQCVGCLNTGWDKGHVGTPCPRCGFGDARKIAALPPPKRKPRRRDLLIVIARLQNRIGGALAANHDRNRDRQAHVTQHLEAAHALCIEALAQDPPLSPAAGPWGEPDESHPLHP